MDERQQKIESCLNLAYKIAHKYKKKGICIGDLKSEAHIQLIRAVDAHQPSKGALTTVVYHYVSNGIRRLFRDKKELNLQQYKESKELTLIPGICLADIEQKIKKYPNSQKMIISKRYGLLGENIHTAEKLSILLKKPKNDIINLLKKAMLQLRSDFPSCKCCKINFIKSRERRKHCSQYCQVKSKKPRIRCDLKVRSCEICQSSFRPKMKKQMVCCLKCNRIKQNIDKRVVETTHFCPMCKLEFKTKKQTKVFCSKKCNFKHYWLNNRKLKAS